MYKRARRRYRARGRDERRKKALRTAVWILMIVCIMTVCMVMAMKTKASQAVAAEAKAPETVLAGRKESVIIAARDTASKLLRAGETSKARLEEEAARVIVIDAGHGGMDGGCVFDGVLEKDINRQIAGEVVRKLRDRGYKAELARQGDDYVEKIDRAAYANRNNALLYVSIHQNSCEYAEVSGIETWYGANRASAESRRLAALIQQETVDSTGAVSRELASDSELCVINKSHMPACLIETGFLSNKDEREKLCTPAYRERIAEGIVRGIERYLDPDAGA